MHKNLLINLLGLDPASTDDQIANAANTFQADMVAFKDSMEAEQAKLLNRAETAEAASTACGAEREKLSNANKAMHEELVTADLERFKDRIVNADEVKTALLNNRAATVAILKNTKAPEAKVIPAAIHDPKTAGTTGPDLNNSKVKTPEQDAAVRISNRARELMNNTKGMSWTSAFIAAKSEQTTQA